MDFFRTIDIEFPSIQKDGKYYSLDLSREVDTPTYKKIFFEDGLRRALMYDEPVEGLCNVERWIIYHNSKYDHLWKQEQGIKLE